MAAESSKFGDNLFSVDAMTYLLFLRSDKRKHGDTAGGSINCSVVFLKEIPNRSAKNVQNSVQNISVRCQRH